MKKLFLMVGFFVFCHDISIFTAQARLGGSYHLGHDINVGVSTERDISGKIIMGIVATALMSKVVYDISWHNSYAATVRGLYSHLLSEVKHRNIESIEHAAVSSLFDQMTCDEILMLEFWLRNSYTSWITPWNWFASQKMAYHQVQVLAIIALHGPALQVVGGLTGQDAIKIARSACSVVSMYPLMYYGQELDRHIEFISAAAGKIGNANLRSMIQDMRSMLGHIKYSLRQEKEYIDEVHMHQTHQLLKEVRNSNNSR